MVNSTRLIIALLLFCAGVPACAATSLTHIDQHVASTPKASTATIKSLAAYLSEPCKSDLEKARAVFGWVSSNIAYDSKAAAAGDYSKQTPEQVLRNRKGVCGGYAYLFEALAEAMGLKQQTITGCSKGLRYVSGKRSVECDHAWNAVCLDGQWRLIDCTWGAGYLDDSGQFVRRRCEHYFLTAPEQFIYDHFPTDPKWQLLAEPITKAEYEKLVLLRPEAFEYGLQPVSNRYSAVACGAALEVSFAAPEGVVLVPEVLRGDSEAGGVSTLVQRAGGLLRVGVSFPSAGKYTLRLYARRAGEGGSYRWAVDYAVTASAGGAAAYPKAYPVFQERGAYLHGPVKGSLTSGATEQFRFTVPGAEAVAVAVGGKFVSLTRQGDEFSGEAVVGGEKISVAARFAGSAEYSVLVEYLVRGQ